MRIMNMTMTMLTVVCFDSFVYFFATCVTLLLAACGLVVVYFFVIQNQQLKTAITKMQQINMKQWVNHHYGQE